MLKKSSGFSPSSDEEEGDIEELQWQQDLEQLTNILSFVIVPLMARLAGRRFAFWRNCPCW